MEPFTATLWRYPGKGGWTFVTLPPAAHPWASGPWGRAAVTATVDGHTWATSVWRSQGELWLPIPKKVLVHIGKSLGDAVQVTVVAPD